MEKMEKDMKGKRWRRMRRGRFDPVGALMRRVLREDDVRDDWTSPTRRDVEMSVWGLAMGVAAYVVAVVAFVFAVLAAKGVIGG